MNPLLEFLTFIGIINSKKTELINEVIELELKSEVAPILLNTYPLVVHSVSKEDNFEILSSKNNQKGVLEDYFYDFLTENLKGILYKQITNSVSIKILDKNYEPDFFIKARNKNYCIEIDEPYTLNYEGDFIPTHYIGIDEDRNKMMSKAGINVIRFSEEQIMKYPNECVKFIEEFIEKENAEMINKINTWSKEDCYHLIEIKHRNTYLPKEFQNHLNKNDYSFRSLKIERINHNKDWTKVSIRVKDYDIIVPYEVFEKSFFENDFIAKNDDLKIFRKYIFFQTHFCQSFRIEGFFKINKQYLNLRNNEFKLIVDDKDKRLNVFFDNINRDIAIKKQEVFLKKRNDLIDGIIYLFDCNERDFANLKLPSSDSIVFEGLFEEEVFQSKEKLRENLELLSKRICDSDETNILHQKALDNVYLGVLEYIES